MSDKRFEELATLAAIGAATDVERAELERLVAADPAAAAEFALWQDTAASLADSLEPMAPPEGGLERLRASLDAKPGKQTIVGAAPAPVLDVASPEYAEDKPAKAPERPEHDGAEIISLAARRQKRILSSSLAVAMAAAAAFLFLWLRERGKAADAVEDAAAEREAAVDAVRKDAQVEIDKLAQELAESSRRFDTLAARYEPLKSAKLELATLSAKGGGFAHVFAQVDDAGEKTWLVVADALPKIKADEDYQLWFVPTTEGAKPVSAGLLRPGPDGVLSATPAVPADLVGTKLRPAISLEPKGGSPQPTQVKLIGDPI